MGFASSTLSDIASPVCESNVSVTSTAILVTVLAPKKTIEIFNADNSNNIYYGDATVDGTSLGIPIVPGETRTFAAVENGFKIYLVCLAGQTATARVISYKGR